jgi:hypothetical protein
VERPPRRVGKDRGWVRLTLSHAFLGFDRSGNGLDDAISAQIDVMIQTGQIQATEGKLQLT